MKLATFTAGAAPELGAVVGAGVVPLSRGTAIASDMAELIARWPELEGKVRGLADAAADVIPLDQVRLLAPIARPGKIMAIGLNYADHIAETGLEKPERQVWFCKQPSSVNGPFDPIQIPKVANTVDYEVELVAVIGPRRRHIARAEASAAVFGYCVGNDVSERTWQRHTPQWVLGKSFDTHAPFGPWITTADEFGDPHGHAIRCLVNGELRQSSNTDQLVFDVWDQIEHLSKAMTLEPGDIIFTGTPGGVGVAMKPPRFLQPGDRVRCEIDGLGAIEAVCEAEA
jgi:2-keto-4-pentenoate hydratase/2-oxohepta-3-ene-1,7-dioic acid hydratase in catechol pathway